MTRCRRLASLMFVLLGTGWSSGQVPPDDDVLITPALEVAAQATTLPDLTFPANEKKIPLEAPTASDSITPPTPACSENAQADDCCCMVGCDCSCKRCRGGLFRSRTRCCRGKPLLRRVASFCRCRG